ncbi:MAG: hypothetical protein JNL60_01760 [Bacteroidia bacterium]|nr:hypothetical protein [Bacteroidia bacterium]
MPSGNRAFYLLLILFVIDVGYSFIQHYQMPLDGDLGPIVLPSEAYKKVLNDPFGLQVLLENKIYPAPNRYFAHQLVSGYFKTVPFLLQTCVSPVKSVYLSCAIAKIIIQVLLILVLSSYICCVNLKKERIILCCVLLSPLFQASHGNYNSMGVIDESVVYTFFYALPIGLLLIFLFPFYKFYITGKAPQMTWLKTTIWFMLVVILSFNGVLIPGIVLVGFPIILISYFAGKHRETGSILSAAKNADRKLLFLFLFFILTSLYSIYIGRNNLENFNNKLSIGDRFSRIPSGLYEIFIENKGLSSLIGIVLVNLFILFKTRIIDSVPQIKNVLLLLSLFILFYILLLPFGGFRDYRPNILRNDTLLPVILIVFFTFGLSTYLIFTSRIKYHVLYGAFISTVLITYSILDTPLEARNWSERMAFKTIDESPLDCVPIKDSCTVFSWTLIDDCAETAEEGKMLKYWGITKKEKTFYHDLDKTE